MHSTCIGPLRRSGWDQRQLFWHKWCIRLRSMHCKLGKNIRSGPAFGGMSPNLDLVFIGTCSRIVGPSQRARSIGSEMIVFDFGILWVIHSASLVALMGVRFMLTCCSSPYGQGQSCKMLVLTSEESRILALGPSWPNYQPYKRCHNLSLNKLIQRPPQFLHVSFRWCLLFGSVRQIDLIETHVGAFRGDS